MEATIATESRNRNARGPYLEFNGLKFSPLGKSPLPDSHGFYKNNPGKGALLYKPNGEPEAYLVNNQRQGHFVVTAHQTSEGVRYMFSTTSSTQKWLKLDGVGYMASHDLVRSMRIVEPN